MTLIIPKQRKIFLAKDALPIIFKAAAITSLVVLVGCSTGPYAPSENRPPNTLVIKKTIEIRQSPTENDDERPKTSKKTAPKLKPVDLSVGPRDAEQSLDLSVDGPILIPREIFE